MDVRIHKLPMTLNLRLEKYDQDNHTTNILESSYPYHLKIRTMHGSTISLASTTEKMNQKISETQRSTCYFWSMGKVGRQRGANSNRTRGEPCLGIENHIHDESTPHRPDTVPTEICRILGVISFPCELCIPKRGVTIKLMFGILRG